MAKGFFLTLEGGEGAGKSTLAVRLARALTEEGREVVTTREPGGTPFGEELRNVLLHKSIETIDTKAELFLFLASRIQHVEFVIKPALQRGAVVLCDRFSDSTIAYQGEGKNLGFEYVKQCSKLAIGDFQPDLTFFIDLEPHVGLKRVQSRHSLDRMEREAMSFHERVRHGFLTLAKEDPKRVHILDGILDPEALFKQAHTILKHEMHRK